MDDNGNHTKHLAIKLKHINPSDNCVGFSVYFLLFAICCLLFARDALEPCKYFLPMYIRWCDGNCDCAMCKVVKNNLVSAWSSHEQIKFLFVSELDSYIIIFYIPFSYRCRVCAAHAKNSKWNQFQVIFSFRFALSRIFVFYFESKSNRCNFRPIRFYVIYIFRSVSMIAFSPKASNRIFSLVQHAPNELV